MKKGKKRVACLLILTLVLTVVSDLSGGIVAQAAKVTRKGYTISKKAGTYTGKITIKLKAKKGYKVYYATNGKLSAKKVVKSGKTKKFTIQKTTTLSVYSVRKSKIMTKAKLKKKAVKKTTKKYKYTIRTTAETLTGQQDMTQSQGTTQSSGATSGQQTTNPGASSPAQATPASTFPAIPGDATFVPGETPPPLPDSSGQPELPSQTVTPGEPSTGESDKQDELDDLLTQIPATQTPQPTVAPVQPESQTARISLLQSSSSTSNVTEGTVDISEENGVRTVKIQAAGTYMLTGGTTAEPIKNTIIKVDASTSDAVNLIWNNLVIDNSALGTIEGQDAPVVEFAKKTKLATVTLIGTSKLIGNGGFVTEPASAVVYAKDSDAVVTFMTSSEDPEASLTVVDSMDADTEYGDADPSDGISSKGTLVIQSGTYVTESNGDCLKGTGSDGEGGVQILGGTMQLTSNLGGALKSKNGCIEINDGKISTLYTAEDGLNAKNYSVTIRGGDISIKKCYGDGIQGENVMISGDSTKLDIETCYEYAGKNFYNTSLGSGNYNTMTTSTSSKTEQVNVDTGSHKGIKAGTKACTYQYQSVEDGSEYVAGTTYTQEASGGLIITGGEITIDTTATGIKYNGSSGGNSSSGNLSAANSDGQYIIGSPDDTIHSNNTCLIAGGTLVLRSADDGITSPVSFTVSGASNITIEQAYEGIESGKILIGSATGEESEPSISVYTNDDGVNASSKSSVSYVYTDESEEVYKKTEVSSGNNDLTILAGYLNVMIADDKTHSFSLPWEGQSTTTGSYSANGDGIDCNGSFYAYGGTVIVYGSKSNDNSPIDSDNTYYIGSGVTLLAAGSSGMTENPTSAEQAYVSFGGSSSSSGPGGGFGNFPGGNTGSSGTVSIASGSAFAIYNASSQLLAAVKAPKALSYVLFSSPTLTSGSSYSLYGGGSVQGEAVLENVTYDCRYEGYNSSSASVLGTGTAAMK